MNILSELTKHLILASRNLPEKKILPVVEKIEEPQMIVRPSQILVPQMRPEIQVQNDQFMPSLLMPKQKSLDILAENQNEDDFGKISSFISDPSVTSIICDGPMKALKVKKDGKSELTPIVMDKSEIDSIINKFSQRSMVPIRPVFRAVVGNMSILALVSSTESRFLITKNQ